VDRRVNVIGVDGWWALPLCFIVWRVCCSRPCTGARRGYLHGQLAKHMLVKTSQYD
jgi:hypothetical protein